MHSTSPNSFENNIALFLICLDSLCAHNTVQFFVVVVWRAG